MKGMFGFGFGLGDFIFNAMFTIIPIIVFGGFIFVFVSMFKERKYNNSQPKIPVEAKVVTKRSSMHGGHDNHSASTSYYVTFEFINGERIEISVPGREFGFLVEGDRGILTFQGRRYISFDRK